MGFDDNIAMLYLKCTGVVQKALGLSKARVSDAMPNPAPFAAQAWVEHSLGSNAEQLAIAQLSPNQLVPRNQPAWREFFVVLGLLLGTTTPKASASRCACLADCAKAFFKLLGGRG